MHISTSSLLSRVLFTKREPGKVNHLQGFKNTGKFNEKRNSAPTLLYAHTSHIGHLFHVAKRAEIIFYGRLKV